MRKPKSNSNKIKTVQINVMDSHNNLDDLKANAGITGNNDVVDNSDIDNMKSILENLKNKNEISEPGIVAESKIEDIEIESEYIIDTKSDIVVEEVIDSITPDYFTSEEIDTSTYIEENEIVISSDEAVELASEPNPYIFDIYEEYTQSHYIHRNIKIRNNEKIKIVIDGHYHDVNKINAWLKTPFNLYIGDTIIFSFYGNSEDNTSEIENIILFRTDHVFVNGKAHEDTNLIITHI